MNSIIYRQADSRWGSLPYPTKAYSFAGNGCGCCAVTHCAIELEQYKNYTPADVRKYMVQFATRGNGTLWAGITKGLEYYGFNVHWNQKDSMSDIWKVLKSSLNIGVILFGSTRGPDKTVWTTSGHFIAFTGYKVENGKHYFYLKDSGGRHHDGWWCYETSMRGDVRNLWVCTSLKSSSSYIKPADPVKEISRKNTYTGTIPKPTIRNGSRGENVKNLQKFLNWYGSYGLKTDGICGKLTVNAIKLFQKTEKIKADGIYGKDSQAKALVYKKESIKESSNNTSIVTKTRTIVDVSYWQHKIDWKKASSSIDGAILRTSYTGQKSFSLSDDSTFTTNINNAYKNNLAVGAYHYSQAISVSEAKKEAEYICKKIEPHRNKIKLPVVIDWEFGGRLNSSKAKSLGKTKCTEIVSAFCEVVKANGYTPMIYANYSTFSSYLNYSELKQKYKIWLAQYAKKASLDYDYWQYTSSGSVSGISGRVDMNKTIF